MYTIPVLLSGLNSSGRMSLADDLFFAYAGSKNGLAMPIRPLLKASGFTLIHDHPNDDKHFGIWEYSASKFNAHFWEKHNLQQYKYKLLIFVVDASSKDELVLSSIILHQFLKDLHTPKLPLLIVANKKECPYALPRQEIHEYMDFWTIAQYINLEKIKLVECTSKPVPITPSIYNYKNNKYRWDDDSIKDVMNTIISMTTTVSS